MIIGFKEKLVQLSEVCKRQGIQHTYLGGVGCFDLLPEPQRVLAITGLSSYADLLEGIEKDFEVKELDFKNTSHLLNAALRKLKLYLPDGLLEKILPTDFVEIYSLDFVPIFKSVNFWGTSSYQLDELYSYPYDDLYERSEFYQAALNRAAKKVFSGTEVLIENPVPRHIDPS